MSAGGKLLLATIAVAIILGAVLYLIAWFDPQSEHAREVNTPFRVWAWRFIWSAIGAGVFMALVGGGLFVIGLGLRSIVQAFTVGPEHGLFPMLLFLGRHITQPVNSEKAQIVSALAWNLDRLNQGSVKAALAPRPDENLLPEPEPATPLTLSVATQVDPRTNPHWLMIGKTGSGKSTAMRHVLTIMARRYPCEFIICEPNRGNWKSATHAWTVDGIAQAVAAVYKEQNRRADILAAHPTAEHIMDVAGERLSYVCLIFAEMDATMDNLYKLDRAQHRITLVQLRDIARMGRKQGVCLFAESQAGLADVLDPNIARNFANIFLFNGSQQTAKTLGVSDLVSLPKLSVGMAFSMTHEQTIEFPPIGRPELRRSQLYQEQDPAALPPPPLTVDADAVWEEEEYNGEDDEGDEPAPPSFTRMPVQVDERLPDDVNEPAGLSEVQKLKIWRTYLSTKALTRDHRPSLNATVRTLYKNPDGEPLKGGVKFYLVREVVREMQRKHGGPRVREDEE